MQLFKAQVPTKPVSTLQPSRMHRRPHTWSTCHALPIQAAELAAASQVSLQDPLVVGVVLGAISAALYIGTKGDPVVCSLCQGTGGATCFGCEGSGLRTASPPAETQRPPKRDFVGRLNDPSKCRVCGGSGMVLCRQCRGTGYRGKL